MADPYYDGNGNTSAIFGAGVSHGNRAIADNTVRTITLSDSESVEIIKIECDNPCWVNISNSATAPSEALPSAIFTDSVWVYITADRDIYYTRQIGYNNLHYARADTTATQLYITEIK